MEERKHAEIPVHVHLTISFLMGIHCSKAARKKMSQDMLRSTSNLGNPRSGKLILGQAIENVYPLAHFVFMLLYRASW